MVTVFKMYMIMELIYKFYMLTNQVCNTCQNLSYSSALGTGLPSFYNTLLILLLTLASMYICN